MAALADVGPAPGDTQLAYRVAAVRARFVLAQVHEELILEAAADPVRVTERKTADNRQSAAFRRLWAPVCDRTCDERSLDFAPLGEEFAAAG